MIESEGASTASSEASPKRISGAGRGALFIRAAESLSGKAR